MEKVAGVKDFDIYRSLWIAGKLFQFFSSISITAEKILHSGCLKSYRYVC
jgi:hypothetical protein